LSTFIQKLKTTLGSEHIAPTDVTNTYSVDGISPEIVVVPQNVDSASRTLALANQSQKKVIPWGGGTQMDIGNTPTEVDMILQLTQLNNLITHEPYDLTVSVEAGMTLESLQRHLAQKGQFLPLEAPDPARATIGGILATNASGPSRLIYGTARDWLIGTQIIHANGVCTKSGGTVVKNVTGYDLNKLYVGSLGTLGVIVAANFKIAPLPKAQQTITASFQNISDALAVSADLLKLNFQPQAMMILDNNAIEKLPNNANLSTAPYRLVLLISGQSKSLARKTKDTTRCINQKTISEELPESYNKELWQAITDIGWITSDELSMSIKVNLLPAQVTKFFDNINNNDFGPIPTTIVDPWSGLIRFVWFQEESFSDTTHALMIINNIRHYCEQLGGYATVERCPSELKINLDVWGNTSNSVKIMKQLKTNLDPLSTLNPGRFIGGI
jgi:glycolate oxidase FAD binding subunit